MAARARGGRTSGGRVIAGTARGRTLIAPGEGTRPLGDRVKQALFAILEPELRGQAFLDLFAGSGAAGIEALSRGAARALFVERAAVAVEAIRSNLASTGLGAKGEVIRADAAAWLNRDGSARGPFAAAFMDPPYDRPELAAAALGSMAAAGPGAVLAGGGVVVAKHFWKAALPAEVGLLRSARTERFGETLLTFYRWAGEEVG